MGTLRAGARLWWEVGWELLGAAAWALHCRQLSGQAGRDTSGSVVGGRTACLGRLCLATGECAERRGAGRGRWGSGLCPQSSPTWPLGAFPHQAWLSLSRCSTGLQGSLPAPQTAPLEPAVSLEWVGLPVGSCQGCGGSMPLDSQAGKGLVQPQLCHVWAKAAKGACFRPGPSPSHVPDSIVGDSS